MKRETTFEDLARDYGTDRFDGQPTFAQMELMGAYMLEEYRNGDETEPFVESLIPKLGEESEHALAFFKLMRDGVMPESQCAEWAFRMAQLICDHYSGLIQDAMDKANEPPYWHDDYDAAEEDWRREERESINE